MKSRIRFNIVDLLICFCVLFCFVITAPYISKSFNRSFAAAFDKSNVIITVKTELVKREYADKLFTGQTVVNYNNGLVLGKISNISLQESSLLDEKSDNYVYAVIEIDSGAVAQSGYYTIEGEKILVNEIDRFSVPDLYFDGTIISINSISAESADVTVAE